MAKARPMAVLAEFDVICRCDMGRCVAGGVSRPLMNSRTQNLMEELKHNFPQTVRMARKTMEPVSARPIARLSEAVEGVLSSVWFDAILVEEEATAAIRTKLTTREDDGIVSAPTPRKKTVVVSEAPNIESGINQTQRHE